MKLWGGPSDTGCCSVADVDDARRVAQQLGIAHHVFNFSDEFDRYVVDPYVADHAAGRTPNPCIECNRHLKFDRLLDRADQLGFDAVATGHHARVVVGPGGKWMLRRGIDAGKDQSYVLHMLGAGPAGPRVAACRGADEDRSAAPWPRSWGCGPRPNPTVRTCVLFRAVAGGRRFWEAGSRCGRRRWSTIPARYSAAFRPWSW